MLAVENRQRLPLERKHAGEHLVKHHAERINIGADVDRRRVAKLLGGHVGAGAQLGAGVGQARRS